MKRILSIDGGGLRGFFSLSFIQSIENKIDGHFADYFDLIAGTSTGGIIALALGLGDSADEILQFYRKYSKSIFDGSNKRFQFIRTFFSSKYTSDALKDALEHKFGDRCLGESKNRLLIPSFNSFSNKIHIYKTAHHSILKNDYMERIVNIALATSAAPVYFPAFKADDGTPLIDGGIWANNPAGIAVVEAFGMLGWKDEEIKVLSLGCPTKKSTSYNKLLKRHGYKYWAMHFPEVFIKAQSSSSLGIAKNLLGADNVLRICPDIDEVDKFELDSLDCIDPLISSGANRARSNLDDIINMFALSSKAEIFEPVHRL